MNNSGKGLRGGSYTVESKKLSKHQQKHISTHILPSLNDDQLKELYRTIESAWSHDALHQDFMPPGEAKKELKLFKGHFTRALKVLETLETDHETDILDRLFAEETDISIKYLSGHSAHRTGKAASRSGIEWMITEIIGSIEARENEIDTNPGGGRGRANRYQKFVNQLITFFHAYIKEIKISSAPNSPFYKLIHYIFSDVLKLENPSPKRTIENIILESKKQKPFTWKFKKQLIKILKQNSLR